MGIALSSGQHAAPATWERRCACTSGQHQYLPICPLTSKGNCSNFFRWKPWWVDAEEGVWWHVSFWIITLISSFFFFFSFKMRGKNTGVFNSVFFFCLSDSQVTFTTVLIKHASWFRINKSLLQGNTRVNLFWQGETNWQVEGYCLLTDREVGRLQNCGTNPSSKQHLQTNPTQPFATEVGSVATAWTRGEDVHFVWITWFLSSPRCFPELQWRAGKLSSLAIPLKPFLGPPHMFQVTQEGPCWNHQHRRLQWGAGTASSSSIPHSNRPCQRFI